MGIEIRGEMRMSGEWVKINFSEDTSTIETANKKFDSFAYDTTFVNYQLVVDGEIKRDFLMENE